jgi:hypothetical protein
MNKLSLTLRVFINTFIISFFVNSIVISAHILTAKEFTFNDSFKVVVLSIEASAAMFAAICVLLYMLGFLIARVSQERKFWILMLLGNIATVLLFLQFDGIFAAYSNEPAMIAAISAFSFLVSFTSQYELYVDKHAAEVITD